MKIQALTGLTDEVLKKGLDASALRQRVTADNVANVNTPGFKRSTVSFEENLNRALENKDALDQRASVGEVNARVIRDRRTSMRSDHNNVDMDIEMVTLSANQIKYNSMIQLLSNRYGIMRYVINEGRR